MQYIRERIAIIPELYVVVCAANGTCTQHLESMRQQPGDCGINDRAFPARWNSELSTFSVCLRGHGSCATAANQMLEGV
ncbi:MAG TPA: hypothetical protein VHK27_06605 [Gammaproteobacteria bacterium]|nr:hypothetical protein [Gammaproteobacteria bacterium]